MKMKTMIGVLGAALACVLLIVVLASSLLKGGGLTTPTVYKAHGKMVFKNGDPVKNTYLTFTPKENGKGTPCEAMTKADGSFEIRSFSNTENDGAMPGEYTCSLEQKPNIKLTSGVTITASVIPKKYQNVKTSGITVVIKSEDNDLGTIKLD
jgi:hypothetical protein